MKIKDLFNAIRKNLKGDKKTYANILVVFLVGVLLVIVSNFFKNTKPIINTKSTFKNINTENTETKNEDQTQIKNTNEQEYENNTEKKLKNTLQNIEGVGKVQVMIYFGCGKEEVPVYDTNDSNSVTEESDNDGGKRKTTQNDTGNKVVMKNNGEETEPFITKVYKPKITGVCVVAEGAKDDLVKLTITRAVVDLFNLPQNKVNVYPMN